MDFSTAVTLEIFFLMLGGVLILFLSKDILQLYGCWSAEIHLKCIWRLFQLYLRTSYTCDMYSNFCLFCYTLCNKSFHVIRHCLNVFFKNVGMSPRNLALCLRTPLQHRPPLRRTDVLRAQWCRWEKKGIAIGLLMHTIPWSFRSGCY